MSVIIIAEVTGKRKKPVPQEKTFEFAKEKIIQNKKPLNLQRKKKIQFYRRSGRLQRMNRIVSGVRCNLQCNIIDMICVSTSWIGIITFNHRFNARPHFTMMKVHSHCHEKTDNP